MEHGTWNMEHGTLSYYFPGIQGTNIGVRRL